MSKKVFKVFFYAIEGQEKWLNQMAKKGLRLVKTAKWYYEFEECSPSEYQYCVEFAADKSKEELDEYKNFLLDLGIHSFSKNLNIGKYSYGSVRLRPYGRNATSLAVSPGNVNSELLILEKKNDGKPFEIFTDTSNKISYYQKIRNALFVSDILLILLIVFGTTRFEVFGNDYSQYLAGATYFIKILAGGLLALLSISTIKYSLLIHSLKNEHKTNE